MMKKIYGRLLEEYGEQGWWPIKGVYSPSFKQREKSEEEKFEISIGAILAQNTSWKNAGRALERLREGGALDKGKLRGMGRRDIAKLIRSAGYYNQKAGKIKEFVGYSGGIGREGLLSIWGIGEETADSILLYAYNVPVFIADAYSRRLFSRMGLCARDAGYGEIQEMAHSAFPPDHKVLNECHALVVEHAKRHCRARPVCAGCPLGGICRQGRGIERTAYKKGRGMVGKEGQERG